MDGNVSKKDDRWEVMVTVLVPRSDAKTVDEAIDAVGERLKPWFWTGHIPLDRTDEQ